MKEIKINRRIFKINIGDVFGDNGTCTYLVSQKVFKDWRSYSPTLSKKLAKEIHNLFIFKITNFTGFKRLEVVGFK